MFIQVSPTGAVEYKKSDPWVDNFLGGGTGTGGAGAAPATLVKPAAMPIVNENVNLDDRLVQVLKHMVMSKKQSIQDLGGGK
ncbi:hypothetical protein TrLO_g15478 [Triparma laevis f. longispina]|uniref:Uncharacterized protein n=2 Tax=Triparma laevis TaxID=1534972 RepID=A0A9W7FG63_9STRA|nr:hypothetical protein TrLO_g15478 [Triparma laevis f. longispina]